MSSGRVSYGEYSRADFDTPGRSRGLLDVIRWRYLLRLLVRTGVTTRYRGSALGWVWSYVRPTTQFLVFWLIMGLFLSLEGGIPNYAVYLFSGIVIINLFSEGYKNATTSIVGNAALIKKIYLPRQLFAISAVAVSFVHFLPQLGLLLVIVSFLGWITSVSVLQIVAMLAAVVLISFLAVALGLLFGAVNVRFRDAENIVELLLMLATWASPVLYHWTMLQKSVPEWLLQLYLLNPITQAVELFHFAFWYPVTKSQLPLTQEAAQAIDERAFPLSDALAPNLAMNTLWAFLITAAVFVLSQIVFRRMEGKFAQDL